MVRPSAAAVFATDVSAAAFGYAATADLHEFSSPTYYWVELNALYTGYIYARRPGARVLVDRKFHGDELILVILLQVRRL